MAAVSKQPSTEVKDVRTVDTVSQFKETQKNLKKAEKNLNEKTEARQKKEAEIYKKEGQSFTPEFKKNGVISYQTKDENQPSALPEVKITRAEMDKKVSKELDEEEKAFDKWKIANYENNMARVNSEDTTLYDKTIGTPIRAISDLLSPLTSGESQTITDEQGNKTFLPSYSELKQQKVKQDSSKLGGLIQDIGYNATKILGAGAIDAVSGGLGGKALYWTDMATDNYKNAINQGYTGKQAAANTLISTGSEFLTERLLGGVSKTLTGGKVSELQSGISKAVNKFINNPKYSNIIGSMGAEGTEEFVQEWIGALNNKLTLGEDIDYEQTLKDALYSFGVGAGSGGVVTGTIGGGLAPQDFTNQTTNVSAQNGNNTLSKVQSLNDTERNALITATQKRKAGQPLDQNDIAAINVINNKPIDVNAQAQNEVQKIQQAVQNGEMSLEDANNVLQSINNEMQQNQEIYSEPMTEQEGNEYYDDYAKTLDNVEEPQATEENKKQEEPKKKRFENLYEKDEKELDEIFNLQREGKELNSKQKEKLKYFERKEKGLKNPEINSEIERFNDVRSDYGIYKRFNPEKFDYTMLDKAKETIQGNRYGRTKQEWLDVAKNIGMQAENLDSKALKKYAFESFAAANPYTDMNKQGNKRTKLELHEWVKSVYDGAKVGTKQETSQPSINNQVEQKIETQENNINNKTKYRTSDKTREGKDVFNIVPPSERGTKPGVISVEGKISKINDMDVGTYYDEMQEKYITADLESGLRIGSGKTENSSIKNATKAINEHPDMDFAKQREKMSILTGATKERIANRDYLDIDTNAPIEDTLREVKTLEELKRVDRKYSSVAETEEQQEIIDDAIFRKEQELKDINKQLQDGERINDHTLKYKGYYIMSPSPNVGYDYKSLEDSNYYSVNGNADGTDNRANWINSIGEAKQYIDDLTDIGIMKDRTIQNDKKIKQDGTNDYEEYQNKLKAQIDEARKKIGDDFADNMEKQRQEYNERHQLENNVYEATKSKPVDNDKINDSFFKEHTSDFDGKTGTRTQDGTVTSMKLQKGENLAKLTFTENEDKIWIDELYVKNQKQGFGSEIVNSIKNYAEKNGKYVEAFKELSSAKGFWDKTIRNNQAKQNISATKEGNAQQKITADTLKKMSSDLSKELNESFKLKKGEAYSRTPQTMVKNTAMYENAPMISDFKRETIVHTVMSDEAAKIDVEARYKENGSLEENAAYIRGLLQSDKRLTKNDKALAIYTMKEALEQGNKEIADGIISDLTVLDVEAGQWVQASKLIKQMTPVGQLQTFIKMVNNSVQKGNPRFKNVKITDEMVNKVLDCYDENNKWDEAKFAKNMEEFKENIQSQMTPTLMDKFNSIRMLGMLGAPRTHIRNVIGNMGNVGLRMSKNINARVMESILIKDQSQRTRTFKPATKEIKDYVSNIAKEEVLGGNKYNDTKTELENNLKTFNENHKGMAKIVNPISKAMNKLSGGNSWLLDREDKLFSSFAYKRSLQEFLAARGMETVEDINSNPKILAEGKEFAMQQALEATYRQDSELAAAISNYVKKSEKPNAKKTDKFLGTIVEANIPFKKTPINIAKTGVEFSPIGLTNGISDILVNVRNGKVEMSQAIDEISKGITGLGLLGIGVLLAHNGFELTAADDDKEKKAKYDKSLGEMEYSIKVGDRYYDLSWMAPSSMPLYTGIELYQALVKEQKLDGNAVVNTLAKTIDPLSSMSLLEGLSKSVKSYSKTPGEFISKFTLSSLENYVTQYVPTLLSQIANMSDDKKRTTTPSGDSSFTEFDKTWNSIKIKVPGLRQTLPEQTDAWGRTQMNESPGLRFFNSFFNPANNSKDKKDATDREIERLYNELGEDSYWSTRSLPKMDFDKFVTISKEKHNLSNEELVKYKKTYGKIAKDGADKLIKTKEYKNATDEEKGQMLSSLYDYANQKAKEEYGKSHNLNYDGYKLDQLYSIVDAYNIPIEKVVSNKSIQQLKADSNMTAKQKKIQAVDNIDGLTGLQKDALKRKFTMFMGNPGYKENEYALVDAVNNSNILQEEKDDIKRFLSLD